MVIYVLVALKDDLSSPRQTNGLYICFGIAAMASKLFQVDLSQVGELSVLFMSHGDIIKRADL